MLRDYSADSQGDQVNKILRSIEQKNHGLLSSIPSQYLREKGALSLEKQDSEGYDGMSLQQSIQQSALPLIKDAARGFPSKRSAAL